MDEEQRTTEDVIKSFIVELNSRGANLDYDKLDEKERLEVMAILMEECVKHMKPFVVHVLGYNWFWFHDVWFDNFIRYTINCHIASRGLGKSFFWSRMLPNYVSFIVSNYNSIISSFNNEATINFLKGIREDYEFNQVLKTKCSDAKSADWNKSTLDFNNKSNIKGISITSQIRSKHVKYFCADDLMNDELKMTPEQLRLKIIATVLPTIGRTKGKFNLIGTRFSEDDIYAFFQDQAQTTKETNYCEIRVRLDEKNEVIYLQHINEFNEVVVEHQDMDDIYDYKFLLNLKIMDPNYFSREYENKIISDDDVPFPLAKLIEAKDKELSYELEMNPKNVYMAGLDFSNSTKKDADDTVLCVGYKDTDNMSVVSEIYSDNMHETPERMKQVKDVMDKFNKVKTLAEQNSMGLTNIQTLVNEGYRLEPFYTDRNKKSDITDYSSIQVKLGRVRFPYKTVKDQRITDKLIHQLSGVRQVKTRGGLPTYTGTTKHDDFYMGFVLMMKQLSKNDNQPTKIRGFKREDLS